VRQLHPPLNSDSAYLSFTGQATTVEDPRTYLGAGLREAGWITEGVNPGRRGCDGFVRCRRSRASVEDVAAWSSAGVDVCRWEELREPVGAQLDCPVALVDESVVSRRRGFHPPPLVEPCVTLSRHTAPVVEPDGSAP